MGDVLWYKTLFPEFHYNLGSNWVMEIYDNYTCICGKCCLFDTILTILATYFIKSKLTRCVLRSSICVLGYMY